MRVLILGGTTEARRLAERLAGRSDLAVTLSLAGRTAAPAAQPVPVRIGGFGGAQGLADYLSAERIDALIDATHPYAAVISANAAAAAAAAGVPIAGAAAAALDRDRRRPLDRGRRYAGGGCARSEPRRAGCSSRSAATSSRRSRPRPSTIIWCAASIRSIRRSPCRMRAMSPAAGRSGKPTSARCSSEHRDRGRGRQEQRRHCDLRQDRGGARARPAGDHAAPAGAAAGAGGRDGRGGGRLARSCAHTFEPPAACRRAARGRDARSRASPPSPR